MTSKTKIITFDVWAIIKQQVRLVNYLNSLFMTKIKQIVLPKKHGTWSYTKPKFLEKLFSLITGFIWDIESRGSSQNH